MARGSEDSKILKCCQHELTGRLKTILRTINAIYSILLLTMTKIIYIPPKCIQFKIHVFFVSNCFPFFQSITIERLHMKQESLYLQ